MIGQEKIMTMYIYSLSVASYGGVMALQEFVLEWISLSLEVALYATLSAEHKWVYEIHYWGSQIKSQQRC